MKWLFLVFILVTTASSKTFANDTEFSFFEATGAPVAYLSPAEELTIYLWSGEPVAYLDNEKDDGPHIYGFNGEHLGWFVKGIIFDNHGKVACASKEALRYTDYEPYKSYKKYKPYRNYKTNPPRKPVFTSEFSALGCAIFLSSGQK